MKKLKRKITFTLFFLFAMQNFSFANSDSLLTPQTNVEINNSEFESGFNYFNLANIVDSFLTNDSKQAETISDDKSKIRKEFVAITSKFNQGNAKVAYSEYEELINKVDNDTSLLALSKVFYEIGFFSLANKAIEKIVYKNQFYDNILDLEYSYKPKSSMTVEEEIYFAKMYASIYFDNSAQEALNELARIRNQYQRHDFYYYTLSRAFLETKQFNNALTMINKTISLNPKNTSYQMFKVEVLMKSGKFKEAKNQIEKIEKTPLLLSLAPTLEIQKQIALATISSESKDRKYYVANRNFVEGNFEKSKKDCLSVLNFDKDNDKILSLYAKNELATGNIERANVYYVNSYKIEKNNIETLIGLGDIRYLHGDYKNAVKIYKKAYKKNKKNYEAIIKLTTAHRQHAQNPKELKKFELMIDKMPKNAYMDYYKSAISIAQKNTVLKEEFLKRALTINPMFENALGELVELHLKNKNYKLAKNLIYNVSFTLQKNYYYYYLCGLYSQATNKRSDAIQFYKTSLNLNPNFEIAGKRLLKLIPDLTQEEI